MAKNLLLVLLLCTLPCSLTNLFAINEGKTNYNPFKAETCNVPAPDSFRITSIGGTFISLAWKPAWVGASHFLSVSVKSPSGVWTDQYVIPDVPDSVYLVDGLEGGKEYRFHIATKCPSGEPSELTSSVDGIALIVDLTLLGRIPNNPTEADCKGIEYKNHSWVGFRISGEGESNLFEVKINEASNSPIGYIKRVARDNPIVAVTENNNFPNITVPIYHDVPIPFKIRHLTAEGPVNIGFVDLIVYSTDPLTIDLCAVLNSVSKPWNNNYIFTALTAKEANSPGGGTVQGLSKVITTNFEAQNPVKDMLRVFVPQEYRERGNVTLRILNSNGQIVLVKESDCLNSQIDLPFELFSLGVYILQIETDDGVHVLKIVKSN